MARPKTVTPSLFGRLAELFTRMEKAYEANATEAGLSCANCATNCCSSYFLHHTYVEWIYLLKGIRNLPGAKQKAVVERSIAYIKNAQEKMHTNQPPDAMCPLNEDGLCILYSHRLMICRMHGTKNACRMPDGRIQEFRGCAQFVAITANRETPPTLFDRTPFYKELAQLEMELHHKAKRPIPRVDMTIAEMILQGPPGAR